MGEGRGAWLVDIVFCGAGGNDKDSDKKTPRIFHPAQNKTPSVFTVVLFAKKEPVVVVNEKTPQSIAVTKMYIFKNIPSIE